MHISPQREVRSKSLDLTADSEGNLIISHFFLFLIIANILLLVIFNHSTRKENSSMNSYCLDFGLSLYQAIQSVQRQCPMRQPVRQKNSKQKDKFEFGSQLFVHLEMITFFF